MADYSTTFSFPVPIQSDEEGKWWKTELSFDPIEVFPVDEENNFDERAFIAWGEPRQIEEGYTPEDIDWPPFEWSLEEDPPRVWIRSDEGGNPEVAAHLVRLFLEKFPSDDRFVTFEGADTCSKLHSDGFGGYAYLITADNVECMTTGLWLAEKIKEREQRSKLKEASA